jgi:hypothetical protein
MSDELEQKRIENYKRIMQYAEKVCPSKYEQFVCGLAYEYGMYIHTTKSTVDMQEVDILISVGKLSKDENGIVTIPRKKISR